MSDTTDVRNVRGAARRRSFPGRRVALVNVDRRIVAWCAAGSRADVEGAARGAPVEVLIVDDEDAFAGQLPPRANPLAYLLDVEAAKDMSTAMMALMSSRPTGWPPLIVFGSDGEVMRTISFGPNSIVQTTSGQAAAQLAKVFTYWATVNQPLE